MVQNECLCSKLTRAPLGGALYARKYFFVSKDDLNRWPFDPKINRGLLPNMDNHPMKFEHCGPNGT
jgi:hypothetical protein